MTRVRVDEWMSGRTRGRVDDTWTSGRVDELDALVDELDEWTRTPPQALSGFVALRLGGGCCGGAIVRGQPQVVRPRQLARGDGRARAQ